MPQERVIDYLQRAWQAQIQLQHAVYMSLAGLFSVFVLVVCFGWGILWLKINAVISFDVVPINKLFVVLVVTVFNLSSIRLVWINAINAKSKWGAWLGRSWAVLLIIYVIAIFTHLAS